MSQSTAQSAIDLKGSLFTLSVLHLTENDLPQLNSSLKAKIEQAPGFFFRAPIVINIEQLEGQNIDFAHLAELIQSLDLVLVGISGGSNEQKQQAKTQGLAVLAYSGDKPKAVEQLQNQPVVEKIVERTIEKVVEKTVYQPTKVVKSTIRSGQQVYAKGTDLVVIGSVGHGAEIIADGNIHVYGTLRGRAIAGASGDTNAKIYCQNIQADLVSISGNYMMSETLQAHLWEKPATVELAEDKLVISELN